MGLITNLLREHRAAKERSDQEQLLRYMTILAPPEGVKVPDNYREFAADNIMSILGGPKIRQKLELAARLKLGQMQGDQQGQPQGKQQKQQKQSGGGHNPLAALLHGLSNLNPAPRPQKPVGSPDQPVGNFLMSKDEVEQVRKKHISDAAEAAASAETARETAKKQADAAAKVKEIQEAIQQRGVNHSLIEASPYLDDAGKRRAHAAYDDKFFGLGLRPGALKFTEVTTAGGKKIPVWEDQQSGQFLTMDHQPVDPATIQSGPVKTSVAQTNEEIAIAAYAQKHNIPVEQMTPVQKQEALKEAREQPSGELKTRTEAQTIIDNPKGHSPSEVQAAKDTIKHLNAVERGIEVRISKSSEGGGGEVKLPGGYTYTPGGQSKMNPQGDPIIDTMAWEFINTGHLPFVGLGGGKGAANKRERAVGRASEILADFGMNAGDLPAIRGNIKANTGALARVTSLGALVQQFENTVEKNMVTARKLSEQWSRTPAPFANRIAAAWKTNTGDPQALNFVAQMHALANEWAKVMQGAASAAGATVSSQQDAEKIMSPYLASGQVDSLFTNVIMPDMRNRTAAIEEEKSKLGKSLRGAVKTMSDSGTVKMKAPNGQVSDVPKDQVEHYKSKGAVVVQ